MECTSVELRVLGSLVEKALTTPDNYPLSTNALVSACNQRSNREPVVDYDDRLVDATMLELRTAGLARTVTGGRANKHRHVLDEALDLDQPELAVLAVLLLRGPQTTGELRTRTERMAAFGDLDAVEEVLEGLSRRHDPLVVQLERRPGQKEARWAHLLGEDGTHATMPGTGAGRTGPDEASNPPVTVTVAARSALADDVVALRADVDRLYELLGEVAPSVRSSDRATYPES